LSAPLARLSASTLGALERVLHRGGGGGAPLKPVPEGPLAATAAPEATARGGAVALAHRSGA